ncbi:MAG: hypothetical protein JNM75_00975 [Rhodospirillales bacterium]|nr:hypothetical protein [Rhodospirillales bacterium]
MTIRSCYGRANGRLIAGFVAPSLLAGVLVLAMEPRVNAAVLSEDPGDQTYLTIAINEALETRKTEVEVPLRNPDTGSHGMLVIERTYYRDPTTPCRDYRRTIERAGAPPTEVRGTGCRIGKALWSLDEVSVPPAARPPVTSRGDAPVPLSPRPASPSAKPGGSAGRDSAPPAGAAAPANHGPAAEATPVPSFPSYTMPSRANL